MDISALPRGFLPLAGLVFLLGVRHGLDADHLAAIDGLTRSNARRRPRLARRAGLLFSLGHGAVVLSVALTASVFASSWIVPAGMLAFGAWVSIGVLVALALVNIAAVFAADSQALTVTVGWRSALLSRWFSAASVPMVLTVGALFALSFDTLSQAALFAVMSARFGGLRATGLLAFSFIVGLTVIDAANGVWISRLLRRADRTARVASRMMGLTVAGVGLLTAAGGVALQTSAAAAAWAEGKELWFGLGVIGIVFTSYLLATQLVGRPSRAAPGRPSTQIRG